MRVIGITGIIGSGKTTAAKLLRKKKYAVITADKIGHALLKKSKSIRARIEKAFHTTSRKKIAKIVFSDKKALKKLNKIMHPSMQTAIQQMIRSLSMKKNIPGIVLEAAVFAEIKLSKYVDEIWFLRSSKKVIKKRLRKKYSKEELNARFKNTSSFEKLPKGKIKIINNNGTLLALNKKIDKLLAE